MTSILTYFTVWKVSLVIQNLLLIPFIILIYLQEDSLIKLSDEVLKRRLTSVYVHERKSIFEMNMKI